MEATLLDALPGEAFALVLVLARIGCACMLLPGIGEAELPATVRAGFAIALSALLLPIVSPLIALMDDQVAAMRQLGVAAAALHSELPPEEARHVHRELVEGCVGALHRLGRDPAGADTSPGRAPGS